MNGFGKEFEGVEKDCILYHSTNISGAAYFIFGGTRSLCCSTPDSSWLMSREVVIVFEPRPRMGVYTPFDGDAGKNFGWDEFRPDDIGPDEIDEIILPDDLYREYLAGKASEDIVTLEEIAEENIRIVPVSSRPEGKKFFRMED